MFVNARTQEKMLACTNVYFKNENGKEKRILQAFYSTLNNLTYKTDKLVSTIYPSGRKLPTKLSFTTTSLMHFNKL